MARNDLELAKSLMTAEQLQQWAELRSRNEVADYGDSVSVLSIYSVTVGVLERTDVCPCSVDHCRNWKTSFEESVHQIISKDDYDSMRSKVEKLKLKISKLEKLPFDQVKQENEKLQHENSVLGPGSRKSLFSLEIS